MVWYEKYLKDKPTIVDNDIIIWKNEKQQYHRENGPAIIWPNGGQQWWKNGELHREYGPATLGYDAASVWCLNGEDITDEVNEWVEEYNYPKWINEDSWDDLIKLHFKLTFIG